MLLLTLIGIESLNVAGMLRNHKLAKSVSDAAMSEFLSQLKYKSKWNGCEIVEAPLFYPSSKTCSRCGNVKKTLLLSERTYRCDVCGLILDRDTNAAINLMNLAVSFTVAACGDASTGVEKSTRQVSMKQEVNAKAAWSGLGKFYRTAGLDVTCCGYPGRCQKKESESNMAHSSQQIVRTPVEPVFIGLDLSLSSTGFCRKQGADISVETIKTDPRTAENDLSRLRYIVNACMSRIPDNTRIICLEDYFTPSNRGQIGSALKLVALGTVMRMTLYEAGMPFYVVSPSVLKKHITGKGNSQKDLIVREVYKRYGIDVKDNNQADGCVLAHIAEQIAMGTDGCPAFQKECIERLTSGEIGKSYNCGGE
jgi:Holliday junction resolvasome RuvABC endonuclease subunit